jgi:hypothetical protein
MLLKLYEPEANYSTLPNTGKELIKIYGFDWPSLDQQQPSPKLPPASPVGDGKYLHFCLESAFSGTSPGIVYLDADLFQFVNVYVDEPHLLPKAIVKRVRFIVSPKILLLLIIQLIFYYCQIEAFDPLFTANLAQKLLLSENRSPVLERDLPHYEVDVFIDESKPFRAKDAASLTPILGRIHSIRPNSKSNEGTRELEETAPFIIGFYCGKSKPNDIVSFLNPTIDEFIRLSPETEESSLQSKRFFCSESICCTCFTKTRGLRCICISVVNGKPK